MQHGNDAQDVRVTLLIDGGHKHSMKVRSDSEILSELIQCILQPDPRTSCEQFFNLPNEDGNCFTLLSSRHICAIQTDAFLELYNSPAPHAQQPITVERKCKWHLENDVLSTEQMKWLFDLVAERGGEFQRAITSPDIEGFRKSSFLSSIGRKIQVVIENRVREAISNSGIFSSAERQIHDIDMQITMFRAGDYFKLHQDAGDMHPDRWLTFVYYFFEEPKQFSGGDLLLYDSDYENGMEICGPLALAYTPRNNSLIIFPSNVYHEVTRVESLTSHSGCRFTVNGWITASG